MKGIHPIVVAGSAAVLGALGGFGIATLSAAITPWRAGDFRPDRKITVTGPSPVAETPDTRFEFGTVNVGGTGFHNFEIRNAGSAPLELTKGATSCSCTVSDFEESEGGSADRKVIAPGDAARLKVKWRGKGDGGAFRQSASVITNDPRRRQIAFVVEGTVVPSYKVVPNTIALPKIAASAIHKAQVKVFTFGKEPPRIASLTATDEKTAGFYSLASAPLAPAEIAAETGATGGFRIDLEVRPGLPLGSIRQAIKATFRFPDEVEAEIPIDGTVTGDIAVVGPAWNSDREAVVLGSVPGRTGSRTDLFLTVKGPHRDAVRPTVREVVPASLQVSVGDAKPVGGGNVLRIPLTIMIPPGSPAATFIGTDQSPAGKIVLDTGHPDTPELTLRVYVTVLP